MIVKIKQSLANSIDPMALIYAKGGIHYFVPKNQTLEILMNGKTQKYFEADITKNDIELIKEAGEQEW